MCHRQMRTLSERAFAHHCLCVMRYHIPCDAIFAPLLPFTIYIISFICFDYTLFDLCGARERVLVTCRDERSAYAMRAILMRH